MCDKKNLYIRGSFTGDVFKDATQSGHYLSDDLEDACHFCKLEMGYFNDDSEYIEYSKSELLEDLKNKNVHWFKDHFGYSDLKSVFCLKADIDGISTGMDISNYPNFIIFEGYKETIMDDYDGDYVVPKYVLKVFKDYNEAINFIKSLY